MTLREDLNALTPRLRRFARALTTGGAANCDVADDLVHATLMRVLGSRALGTSKDVAARCFSTLVQLNRETMGEPRAPSVVLAKPAVVSAQSAAAAQPYLRQNKLAVALMGLAVEEREALLLVALEPFDHTQAARILRISKSTLFARLTRARDGVDQYLHQRPVRKAVGSGPRPAYLRLVD